MQITDNQWELLNFPFERVALKATDMKGTQYSPDLDAIVKPSDGKVLGVLPAEQFVMSHADAYRKVESALEAASIKSEITQFHLLRNGARFFTHFRLPEMSFDVGVNGKPDVLYPEVILRNALDGDFNFGLEWGVWRQICTNGARALVLGDRVTKKSLMGDTDVEVMITQIKDFVNHGINSLADRIHAMQQPIEQEKAVEVVEDTVDFLGHHFSDKLLERFGNLTTEQEGPATEWSLFNNITNVSTHDVRSYARRRGIELAAARRFHLEGFINNGNTTNN